MIKRMRDFIAAVALVLMSACGSEGESLFERMHGSGNAGTEQQGPVSFSIREMDGPFCETQPWASFYDVALETYKDGIASVEVADLEQQAFAWVRAAPEFADNAEGFVEHIKDIPGQLVEIIREDPTVLESCENLAVALVGPP